MVEVGVVWDLSLTIGYPYKDYTPGFAPDIFQMTNGTNAVYGHPMWDAFGEIYCGLEAKVYNPDTKLSSILYITDAFDHKYVLSEGSIDIMAVAWSKLTKVTATNKNNVIKNVEWTLTGNRNPRYLFKGLGDP